MRSNLNTKNDNHFKSENTSLETIIMSSSLENRSSIRKLEFPICSLEVLRRLHVHFSANIPHSPSKGSVISPVSNSGSLMSPKGKVISF